MAESQAQSEQRLDAGELFRRHSRFVANFLWKLGVGAQEIDDLVQEVFVVEKPLPIYEQIRIAIEKYVADYHVLPPVNKFSEENDFSKAYVSTSLNEYIFKNQKWLLNEGLVDLDRVQKAKNSVEKVKPGTTEVDEDGWPIK